MGADDEVDAVASAQRVKALSVGSDGRFIFGVSVSANGENFVPQLVDADVVVEKGPDVLGCVRA